MEKKRDTTPEELCKDFPKEFEKYCKHRFISENPTICRHPIYNDNRKYNNRFLRNAIQNIQNQFPQVLRTQIPNQNMNQGYNSSNTVNTMNQQPMQNNNQGKMLRPKMQFKLHQNESEIIYECLRIFINFFFIYYIVTACHIQTVIGRQVGVVVLAV